jgi:hypothetical protein
MSEQTTDASPKVAETPPPSPSVIEVIFPPDRQYKIGDRVITVKPSVGGKLKRVEGELREIGKHIAENHPDFDLEKPGVHLALVVPSMVGTVWHLLAELFDIEESYLDDHLTILEAVEIMSAWIEVNRLPDVLKKALSARMMLAGIPSLN